MIIALTFVFTTALAGFATMSAVLRIANEDPVMGDIETVIHALVIATGLVGSVFAPILAIPALVSTVFFAPQLW